MLAIFELLRLVLTGIDEYAARGIYDSTAPVLRVAADVVFS